MAAESEHSGTPVVYLHGYGSGKGDLWFRFGCNSVKLDSVAQHKPSNFGNWIVIGEEIYSAVYYRDLHETILRKHDFRNPGVWEDVPARVKHPYWSPFIVSDVEEKNLYLLGGYSSAYVEDLTEHFGHVFNLKSKTFRKLKVNFKPHPYFSSKYAAVTENKRTIVFYDIVKGEMLFYSLKGSTLTYREYCNFNLPSGGPENSNLSVLRHVIRNIRAVESDNTLYWFTYDLYLYGYDYNRQKWFRSEKLDKVLNVLKPQEYCYRMMVLVNLCNGKFMVIHHRPDLVLAVASFRVVKTENDLNVYPDTCLTFDDFPVDCILSYGGAICSGTKSANFEQEKSTSTNSNESTTTSEGTSELQQKFGMKHISDTRYTILPTYLCVPEPADNEKNASGYEAFEGIEETTNEQFSSIRSAKEMV